MKVIFITREGYTLSGARVRCYNFARELRGLGLDTEVFSFADNLGAQCGEKEAEMNFSKKMGYNFRAIKSLRTAAKDTVFYMQRFNYHSLAPLWLSLWRKNRVIFDCDDWNIRENPVYHLGFYPSSKMEFFTRRVARYSDICIAASRFLEEYLKAFNPHTYYVPTGVDTGLFKPVERNASVPGVRFSWIGTAYHKEMGENLRFILDCFSSLAERHENIFLSLAGEGKYFEEIKASVSGSRFNKRVTVECWIPPEKIPHYLAGIDIGLLPLIQDTRFNNAKSPTKLFEYMATARTAVCSRSGEADRIIRDGENGMLAGSKEEFIEKMELLIEQPALRQRLGRNARETVERDFSLKVLGKRLYDILTY